MPGSRKLDAGTMATISLRWCEQDAAQFFFEHGCVVVEDVLSGQGLADVQAAWADLQQPAIDECRLADGCTAIAGQETTFNTYNSGYR